ncbi:hypothetical protein ACFYY8_26925 [Streptosporangium sp. NPDC001559]|uniref:hypothetical protein n=1 Tax=Streptosporangium sp. NPDC001559 TaxID=3366187 RepID=UPI0036E109E9
MADTGPAAEVTLLIAELAALLERLAELLAEPILMDIHEGVRRLETSLRREAAGHLGERRGGSDANTAAALASIARLVHAVPEEAARHTARILSGWTRRAEEVRDIGLAERWEPLRAPAGELPPSYPYCKTFSLRVGRRAGQVRCVNRKCVDGDGRTPVATIDKNRVTDDAMLIWRDGRTIYYGCGEAS